MNKQDKYNQLYMDIAIRVSQMSHAERLKVGAVCVKDDRIISMGWNGMPAGWDNCCEHTVIENSDYREWSDIDIVKTVTRPEVLHAEENVLAKLARSTESSEGSAIYCTHSPCLGCAKLMVQAGIKTVYYLDKYRDAGGIDLLQKSKVDAIHIKNEQ